MIELWARQLSNIDNSAPVSNNYWKAFNHNIIYLGKLSPLLFDLLLLTITTDLQSWFHRDDGLPLLLSV